MILTHHSILFIKQTFKESSHYVKKKSTIEFFDVQLRIFINKRKQKNAVYL
jgi:hypothetical protein